MEKSKEKRASANGNNIELHPIWPEDENEHVLTTLERVAHIAHDKKMCRQRQIRENIFISVNNLENAS